LLTIVSHPDDETFGCGATLVKHVNAGIDVHVYCLTCEPEHRETEFKAAVDVLGVSSTLWMENKIESSPELIRKIADVIDGHRPKTVITHVPFDYHREHRVCYEVVKEAVEWAAHTTMYADAWQVERLLLMEVNTLIPQPSVLVDVSEAFNQKMKAVEQYRTQLDKFPWRYYENVCLKKGELRGAQCNVDYAEAFLEEALPKDGPFYSEKSSELLV
jgi:LmbE family N-acetylglucosaminyl deacetylase